MGGSGNDAEVAQGGNNILDGGAGGVNFLVGGNGSDTFFLSPTDTTTTWDEIQNFHKGDLLAIWGWKTDTTTWNWTANDGLTGYTGETLHTSLNGDGTVNASVTFVGATSTDNLLMFQGPSGGTPYCLIYNSG
jgi:serralysin